MIDKRSIERKIEPLVTASGLDLEEVELTPAGRRTILRVILDGDDMTLDDVAGVSREISALIDSGPEFGESSLTLEVTSRGVDRPLTLARHWRRNQGRLVAVTLNNGEKITGRISSSDDSSVVLVVDGSETSLAFADISKARIEVEFKEKP